MPTHDELNTLIERARARGVLVLINLNLEAFKTERRALVESVRVVNADGIDSFAMSPTQAAECLRKWLTNKS